MTKIKENITSVIMIMITIIMITTIIWLAIIIVGTTLENSKTKAELEETKQELAEYKADELEIYPCPFCGSENVLIVDMYGKGTDYYVRCEDCHSSGPTKNPNTDGWDMSKAEAIELWNTSYKRGSQ